MDIEKIDENTVRVTTIISQGKNYLLQEKKALLMEIETVTAYADRKTSEFQTQLDIIESKLAVLEGA